MQIITINEITQRSEDFRYRLLGRLSSDFDCLIEGLKPNHLWAKDIPEQLKYMRAIWDSFPADRKPQWLTQEQIQEYEEILSNRTSEQLEAERMNKKVQNYPLYSFRNMIEIYKKEFPDGITFPLEGVGTQEILRFIHEGHLFQQQGFYAIVGNTEHAGKGLQAAFFIAPDNYNVLYPSCKYENNELEDFLKQKRTENNEYLDSIVTEALMQHPQGKGVDVWFNEDDIYEMATIEGVPFNKAVAVMLQFPDLTDDGLKELLHDDSLLLEKLKNAKTSQGERSQWNITVGSLNNYFHEKGTLGYIAADYDRKVTTWGCPMNSDVLKEVENFINEKNKVINKTGHWLAAFEVEGDGSKKMHVFKDTRSGKIQRLQILKDEDGTEFVKTPLGLAKKEDLHGKMDITDRMTVLSYKLDNVPMVRYKIDDKQMTTYLDDIDYLQKLKQNAATKTEFTNYLKFLIALDNKSLFNYPEPERSNGLKR